MSHFIKKKHFSPLSIALSIVPGAGLITTLSLKAEISKDSIDIIPLYLQGIFGLIVGSIIYTPAWARLPIKTEGEFITYRFQDKFAKPLHIFRSIYVALVIIPLWIATALTYLFNDSVFPSNETPYFFVGFIVIVILSTLLNSILQRVYIDKAIGLASLLFVIYFLFDMYTQSYPAEQVTIADFNTINLLYVSLISWWWAGLVDMPDMNAQKIISSKKFKYPTLILLAPGLLIFVLDLLILFGPKSTMVSSPIFKIIIFLNLWQIISSMQHWSGNLTYENVYKTYIQKKENQLLIVVFLATPIILAFVWAFIFQSTSSVLLTLFGLTAGVGPVYALRWFWWRINALTQITAMIGAILLSYFKMEILGLSWIQQMNNLLPLQPIYNELLILGCLNCLFWLPTLLIQNKEEKRKSKLRVFEIGVLR